MKKRIILAVVIIIVCAAATIVATGRKQLSYNDDNFYDEFYKGSSKQAPTTTSEASMDFYAECEIKATTKKQKENLEKVKNNKEFGIGYYKRDALIAIGELPENKERLTLDKAKVIIKNSQNPKDALKDFDIVAGAPDYDGGSGFNTKVYFLNDEHTEAIRCENGRFFTYVKKDKDSASGFSEKLN